MTAKYDSVAEVFEEVATLRDELQEVGALNAADELSGVIGCAWATASEAVGEARLSLQKVRPEVQENLPQRVELLDELVSAAQRLWEGDR